ncbi:MAG: adenosylcobalamin-dependent ribonucleoside-diphosphate reductase [Candidatus Thiodiazotropha sp. (ex Epidulcina cf. delphinae)]|nr:adenosylcobalamin-dependent ribonucleoside-diphosphate reductase [Candidatus Thiodiazotropha sp. (ex Epidulcina cf. delphinae)]
MYREPFDNELSQTIWESKYRYRDGAKFHDQSIDDTWRRVARAVASTEGEQAPTWEARFHELLRGFRFLPGGRILAGAGTRHRVTLFNCFVMGEIADSVDGIFEALKEGAVTMQQGGGVGYDFSSLRPRGASAAQAGALSSGPVSFMRIWDAMCETLRSTGNRRGAMMGILRCNHPDIEEFINAKRDFRELRNFNLSVLVTDAFMQAVRSDDEWPLIFPVKGEKNLGDRIDAVWSGYTKPVACRIHRRMRARDLWQRLMRAAYDTAEPGVLFIDRINDNNNLYYRERISATNPCGEIPLPPYGACDLGSINLTQFVTRAFSEQAEFAWSAFKSWIATSVRFMDDVITLSHFPLPAQREQATATRRIGLGVTGLADMLMMLGLRYGDQSSFVFVDRLFCQLRNSAYRTSCALAQEKGAFPGLRTRPYLKGAFIRRLPKDIQTRIGATGIRNSHLLAMAPTGTISLLANNVSSGLEPVFGDRYQRKIRQPSGGEVMVEVIDYAWRQWRMQGGDTVPDCFVTARELDGETHLAMQARIQPYVDNAISKTVNLSRDTGFGQFSSLYEEAHALGLKGCTAYRPNPVSGEVLHYDDPHTAEVQCCSIDREGA